MKTKEEIQQRLIEEQMQVDAFEDMQPETIADAIVKEKGIVMHKSKVSLLEWILEDSEVEPSAQYVVKSTYPDEIVEFFAYYDDVNQEAFWVEDAQPAKKFDSKEKAKEFIIQLWGYIPNWFSVEEYSN